MFNRGYLTISDLNDHNQYPDEERFKRGPVVVCECVERIPCNPCESACNFHAIKIGEDISNIPEVDFEKCSGCGLCIAACPGLAIFMLDKSYSKQNGKVSFPYEYPKQVAEGMRVNTTDRSGQFVCEGMITRIMKGRKLDGTTVVTVEVPIQFVDDVRGIRID